MPENKDDIDLDGWDLYRAARENRVDIARALIERGDDVNDLSGGGLDPMTPMSYQEGSSECNVDYNWTPLHVAVLNIAFGPSKETYTRTEDGYWELSSSLDSTHDSSWVNLTLKMVRLLVTHGARINAASGRGWTPLHMAIYDDALSVAGLLLELGADVNARDKYEKTPLHFSSSSWSSSRLLIDHSADVNARDKYEETPLHYASLDVAPLLIDHGADVNALNDRVGTPLHIAARLNHHAVVRLLIENEAEIEAISSYGDGWTPLQVAIACHSFDAAQVLIERGANTEGMDLKWMENHKISSKNNEIRLIEPIEWWGEQEDA